MRFKQRTYEVTLIYIIFLILILVGHMYLMAKIEVHFAQDQELVQKLEGYKMLVHMTALFFFILMVIENLIYYKGQQKILKKTVEYANKVKGGNFSAEPDPKIASRDDEWGEMTRAFGRIVTSMKLLEEEE
jgi:methyl-accepting chemotaxis protein